MPRRRPLAAAAVELFLAFCSGFFTQFVVSASISIAKCVASAVLDIWGKKKRKKKVLYRFKDFLSDAIFEMYRESQICLSCFSVRT